MASTLVRGTGKAYVRRRRWGVTWKMRRCQPWKGRQAVCGGRRESPGRRKVVVGYSQPQAICWVVAETSHLTTSLCFSLYDLILMQNVQRILMYTTRCVFKNSLFWSKYKFTGSCRDSTKRLCVFSTQFPPSGYIKARKLTVANRCVYSSIPFYHLHRFQITTMAIKIQSYSITTKILPLTFFNVFNIWPCNT